MTEHSPIPDLRHIPGPTAPPVIGHTLDFVRHPYRIHRATRAKYGDVYRLKTLGRWVVQLQGADAVEMVLMDRDRNFSSEKGWWALKDLFPGGLMLRDFDDHRAHRRVMQVAFRVPAMRDYLLRMEREIGRLLEGWPVGTPFAFYPAIKTLTLQLGAHVFMGIGRDDEAAALNDAFAAEVAASVAVIRSPLPFTPMRRGVRARAHLTETFRGLIAERRAAGGEDLFSELCRAEDEDGVHWSDQEIVDHFNFLMMAAHDTTTSALTTMAWALAEHPDWQEAIREELAGLPDGPLPYEALEEMVVTERVFREALRLMPPVPFIPRVAFEGFSWAGHDIPAGAPVVVAPGLVMRDPALWSDPDRFDPDRFTSNRAEDRNHRFAWAPFGGGAHKCIGLNFAYMQVKAFTRALLSRHRLELAEGGAGTDWAIVPIPKPKNGLPLRLRPV